jgi:hypothetical protein
MAQTYNPIVRRFNQFRAELLSSMDIARHEVRPGTPLASLIPLARRRDVWLRLQLQGFRLPPLCPPAAERTGLIQGLIRSAAGLVLGFEHCYGLLAGRPLGMSWPQGVEFPACLTTVGEAILYATSVHEHKGSGYRWTRNEIATKVRLIIAESCGLPLTRVQRSTTFMELD